MSVSLMSAEGVQSAMVNLSVIGSLKQSTNESMQINSQKEFAGHEQIAIKLQADFYFAQLNLACTY